MSEKWTASLILLFVKLQWEANIFEIYSVQLKLNIILWFLKACFRPGAGNKSGVLTDKNAPHSGESASFRRHAWSNARLYPGYDMGKRGFTLSCSFSYSFFFYFRCYYLLTTLENNILSTLLTLCFKYKKKKFFYFS